MKILLIEDSKTLRRLIRGYVESEGHTLVEAETGEIALQLLETEQFDLILSDVDMPGLGGFDTVRLVREMLGEHWVPIIFITSRDEDEDFVEGFDAGGDDYIVKPIREVFLQAKIRVMERFINMQSKLYELLNQPEPPQQFDPLTQCYNSHSFLHLVEIQWSVLARRNEPVSMLLVDIDYFSEYREFYGADKGDKMLQYIAKSVKKSVLRPNDFVGRMNKNDFMVMLPATDEKGALEVANRMLHEVEILGLEHKKSPLSGNVTISISGISTHSFDTVSLKDLLSRVSTLMHRVKFSHGEPVCIHEIE